MSTSNNSNVFYYSPLPGLGCG